MKKLQLLLLVLVLVAVSSCKKESVNQTSDAPKYVKAIDGKFIAKDGDITFKSTPVGENRTWTMYAKNSEFYGNVAFALVNGSEFITNSAAYNFWHNTANNPVSFPANQGVYSNLTPDEDLRIISETKDANNNVVYLGILDFEPTSASFPLTVNCFRLGDVLQINTDAITRLPGGSNLTITATFGLAPVDLAATKLGPLTGTAGVPNGQQFKWEDIIYGAAVSITLPVGVGNVILYEGLDKKVMGDITITITENGNGGSTIIKTVNAQLAGKGMLMTLSTTKTGWFDSSTIAFSDRDIDVTLMDVPVN